MQTEICPLQETLHKQNTMKLLAIFSDKSKLTAKTSLQKWHKTSINRMQKFQILILPNPDFCVSSMD
jgi:hypothetical protein